MMRQPTLLPKDSSFDLEAMRWFDRSANPKDFDASLLTSPSARTDITPILHSSWLIVAGELGFSALVGYSGDQLGQR